MNQEFGTILQGLLDNRGLTVPVVAHAASLSHSTIYQLQTGRIPPSEKLLRAIAPVMQIPSADLFVMAGIAVEPPPGPPPPYPKTPGISRLIHAASPLTSEQLGKLAELAGRMQEENDRLRDENFF
jgi:transcriptional regulator with XRE-family HTH domain